MSRDLKLALLAEYGSFANPRIKKLEKSDHFIVDSRDGRRDHDAKGHLFNWFAVINLFVVSETEVTVRLGGKTAHGDAIDKWVEKHGDVLSVGVKVTPGTVSKLRELAQAHRDIVRPGVWAAEPSFKFMCPRTAESLDRLAKTLDAHWGKVTTSG